MDTPTDQTPASTPAATAPAAPAAPAAATGARLSAEARRAQLVDVAHDILRRAPLEPLSPEQVAAEAGVSKPLVFHYFPTVADLQIAVFQHVTEDLVAHLATELHGTTTLSYGDRELDLSTPWRRWSS